MKRLHPLPLECLYTTKYKIPPKNVLVLKFMKITSKILVLRLQNCLKSSWDNKDSLGYENYHSNLENVLSIKYYYKNVNNHNKPNKTLLPIGRTNKFDLIYIVLK